MTDLDKIEEAFSRFEIGTQFSTSEIRRIIQLKYDINDGSINPADYCYNRMNIGKWNNSSLVDFNIFEYVKRGTYIYLGTNYLYNGNIKHQPMGNTEEDVIGEWIDGKKIIYGI